MHAQLRSLRGSRGSATSMRLDPDPFEVGASPGRPPAASRATRVGSCGQLHHFRPSFSSRVINQDLSVSPAWTDAGRIFGGRSGLATQPQVRSSCGRAGRCHTVAQRSRLPSQRHGRRGAGFPGSRRRPSPRCQARSWRSAARPSTRSPRRRDSSEPRRRAQRWHGRDRGQRRSPSRAAPRPVEGRWRC